MVAVRAVAAFSFPAKIAHIRADMDNENSVESPRTAGREVFKIAHKIAHIRLQIGIIK